MTYEDMNCDGIDGDLLASVFLDPQGGSDGADGLSESTPLLRLDAAYAVALAEGLDQVLIAEGTAELSGDFVEGVHLAGGYEVASAWARTASVLTVVPLDAGGAFIAGWIAPTEWQQIEIVVDAASAGQSSFAMVLDGSQGLLLASCWVSAADGGDSAAGASGAAGSGGDGGGASVAILLASSSIELLDCTVVTGDGGDGGLGGHGAGGGGGPVVGVQCEGSSTLSYDASTSFSTGNGGQGGSSSGDSGASGLSKAGVKKMLRLGYINVFEYAGGAEAWPSADRSLVSSVSPDQIRPESDR